ncbi:radical SAM protein [Candidatus Woesearchaeota archaeon]|nr:radical SAM protein [Candidatus Woesearchaeota archaeon]
MPGKKIIGMSFPRNNLNLGLEPSILNVLPQGDNVEYCPDNSTQFDDNKVEMFLCSVYIAGMDEFKKWAAEHDTKKIIAGGYHPTMFPEDFVDFADKIVMGPCDDLEATLSQQNVLFEKSHYDSCMTGNDRFVEERILRTLKPRKGWIRTFGEIMKNGLPEKASGKAEILKDKVLPGVLTFKNTPRFDLYNIMNNQQVIPDKKHDDLSTSINTSFGCPYKCDFCCTPVMFGPHLISKPLEAVEREVSMIKKRLDKADDRTNQRFLFIRDENFTLQKKDYKKKLEMIAETEAKIYLFASANTLTDEIADNLAKNNVYMICLGLEDPTVEYGKNRHLDDAVKRLKKRGIFTYLSFIVDPLRIVGAGKGKEFYEILMKRFEELKPEMVCGNFLMPFPGTPMWDKYYHLVSKDDFREYNSKTPFLIKNRIVHEKMRYFMFKSQWDYYTSEFYNKHIRRFDAGDTLHERFVELKKEFDRSMEEIKHIRP